VCGAVRLHGLHGVCMLQAIRILKSFRRLSPQTCKFESTALWPVATAAPMQARRSLSVVLIDEDGATTRPVPRLSGNTKSLLMMFVLFTLITAAQWVGGVMAHSLALQADCASMGVDALSYVGNMLAECQTDRRSSTLTTRPSAWHAGLPRLVALRAEVAPSDPLPQQQGHVPQPQGF